MPVRLIAILIFVLWTLNTHAQFTTLWTYTVNPSTGSDYAYAITADAGGIYVAGWDYSPGNFQWRIEKHDLNNGALIAGFGTAGVVTGTATARVYAITADASGIYVAGYDNGPGNNQWRIEKRDLNSGVLIAGFGTAGVVTFNPSTGTDNIYAITTNASGIYVAGFDNSPGPGNFQWRIEKRDLNSGALIAGFGTAGVVTSNPSTGIDFARAITADASGIYVAGYDNGPGNNQWRIEKRDLTTGAFISSFGTAGVITNNPSGGMDWALSITVDVGGIYVAGLDNSPGNNQWRIEKRDLNSGALIAGFGTAGVVTDNFSTGIDYASTITTDASGIYVAGQEEGPGNAQWRLEKRNLTTGSIICTQTSNPSVALDIAYAVAVDASGVYVAGQDNIPGGVDYQWRIEKYNLCGIPPAVTASGATICEGDCATLNATASGGTSPYAYSWNSGGQTTSGVMVCPTVTTVYTVTITDANSSTATTTVTVTVNPLPTMTITPSGTTLCFGQIATLNASGGINYIWSPGGETTTGIFVSPTANSSYTVTGEDTNGCSNVSTASVTVEPLPFANAGPDISMCAGASATLNASGNGSFQWSPPTGLSNTTIANPVASHTTTITYTLTVTNNCGTATDEMTISTPLSPSAGAGNDVTICKGSSTTLLGSGAGTFVWSPAGSLSCSTCQNPVAAPIATTTYTLTITDICGAATDSVKVTVNDPVVTISGVTTLCSGSSTTLTASGTATYNWLPAGQTSPAITVNPTTNSTYTVTGTDADGCTNSALIAVMVNPLPNIILSPSTTICNGTSATLTAGGGSSYIWMPGGQTTAGITVNPTANTTYSVLVSDGVCSDTSETTVAVVPDVTASIAGTTTICNGMVTTLIASGGTNYAWNTGETTTILIVNPSAATSYSVVVAGGICSDSENVTITVNPTPSITISGSATLCSGSSATLSAGGGITYIWAPAGETTANITVSPAANSSYTVTGTDMNGCSNTAAASLTVEPLPFANAGPDISMCAGANATINASGNGSFQWSPSTGLNNTTIANPVASHTTTITYTLTVTNNCGTAADSMTITTPATPSANAGTDATICAGDNTLLLGSGAGTFVWSPATGLSCATCQNPVANPGATTTYTLTITDVCGSSSDSVTITVKPISAMSQSVSICSGTTYTLPSGAVVSTGGTYMDTLASVTGCDSIIITALTVIPAINAGQSISICIGTTYTLPGGTVVSTSGVYIDTLVSASGCDSIITTTLSVVSVLTSSQSASICSGTTYILPSGAAVSAAGTYQDTLISTGGCDSVITTTLTVVPAITASQSASICTGSTYTLPSGAVVSAAGIYTDTLTSANGCDSIITTTLAVNPLPAVTISPDITITQGATTTLTAGGGGLYLWSSGEATQSISVSPVQTTTYCVTVTDNNGCTDKACVTVTVDPLDCDNAGELYLPNIFSPNGDGENDFLQVYYGNLQCIKTLKLTIYDRWGEKVYETGNLEFKWDGSDSRGILTGKEGTAVFVYYLDATLISGDKVTKKGNVSILR